MVHNKDYPVFDADPLSGAQAAGGITLAAATLDGNVVTATLALRLAPNARRTVKFVLQQRSDRWVVDDIDYANGRTLRGVLAAAK